MSEPTRHQCMIYEGLPSRHLPRLVPMLLRKLESRHRCLFLGSLSMVALIRVELAGVGLDVSEQMRKGALVLSTDQSHLKKGYFDPDQMLQMLADTVTQSLRDGYTGLWATGDMTWEFGREQNLSKLLEYECGLEKLFRKTPALSGVCQYHRDTLPLDMIGNALYTHRSLYLNHTLQRVNPFYLQPEALMAHRPPRLMPEQIEEMFQRAVGQN